MFHASLVCTFARSLPPSLPLSLPPSSLYLSPNDAPMAQEPCLIVLLNLEETLHLHHGRAFVGFTAATGRDTWQVSLSHRNINENAPGPPALVLPQLRRYVVCTSYTVAFDINQVQSIGLGTVSNSVSTFAYNSCDTQCMFHK